MWVPRFVVNAAEETVYIKEETTPGDDWTVPDLFMHKVSDNTKPDFSLGGIWLQKDVDINYGTKISQMSYEQNTYGFIKNTIATPITYTDTVELQKYVGATIGRPQINDPTNLNRIVLKIVDTTKYEPIKANIQQNTVENRIEIRVTYTANGISKILDEYGNAMTLTEENGIILTDTGSVGLAKGTYSYTVIDNKGNKKELSITPSVDSLFKVAYISGTDNMDINATYKKTQETKTSAENTLLSQVKATDTTKTFDRAIQDSNKAITAIGEQTRTADDEQMYMYGKYKANKTPTYKVEKSDSYTYVKLGQDFSGYTGYSNYSITSNGITLSGSARQRDCYYNSTQLGSGSTLNPTTVTSSFYYFDYIGPSSGFSAGYWDYNRYTMRVTKDYTYSRGDFDSNIIALDGTYENNKEDSAKNYWYIRNSLAPKYTLYKYDSDLNLKSTYDVDTKTIITEPIDISNKGNNKLKLILKTSGSDYKTYISNDNTNWQEVTDISYNTPKELSVDGWDKLYIKIETNTSRIDDIDVSYYKD